jgi:hypothetical protein
MPRHAFGARPGDRYKYKCKYDDGHEGRQDHPFVSVANHFLPQSALVTASESEEVSAVMWA